MLLNKEATIGEFMNTWLEIVIKGNVRFSTYTSYKGYISNHINRIIGSQILCETKPACIQGFVSKLVSEGKLAPRTVGIIIGVLKSAFSYAEDYELIIKSPCRRIKLPKVEEEEVRIFDNDEQTRIEKTIFKSNDNRCYGILFTLYTGVRIGELCALRWENVDFKNKCIHIKKSLNRSQRNDNSGIKTMLIESEPKTKKSKRTIHLPDFIVTILKRLRAESKSSFVFSMKDGRFIQPRTMQMLHKRILEQAGVKYNNFHVLRHTFASRAGATSDAKTVSETLGHSNVMITVNRYMHSQREQKLRMMKELNLYFQRKKITTK